MVEFEKYTTCALYWDAHTLWYIRIYVTDHFATWTVLKRAAGFQMGWPVLNPAGPI